MAIARTRYEQRSVLNAIQTYLTAQGFTGITFTDGYQPENVIAPPQVSVYFPPSSPRQLQLGRVQGQESLYSRSCVVNCYMENEDRASAIVDAVMDFLELECIEIKDHTNTTLGTVQCNNTDLIVAQVFAPIMGDPKVMRWRGAVTAPMDSFYPSS